MCLILFAYRQHPDYPLVVAANRDEFYARPAEPAQAWGDYPHVVAGRDLEAGGTWLGVSTTGRFAAVTNFAEEPPAVPPPNSRGALTDRFLAGSEPATDYAASLAGDTYRGYNLLLFDGTQLVYTSNRAGQAHPEFPDGSVLAPGIYGLANAALGADWPKVRRGGAALADALHAPTLDGLIALLHDDALPPDHELPDRGNDLDRERFVAPCFIRGDAYGTRASSAVLMGRERIQFAEQLYGPDGERGDRRDLDIPMNEGSAAG